MLYDEEGKPYVEPPLLPEDIHIQYIVKDYQRMYKEYWKLKDENKKVKEKNKQLNALVYSYKRLIKQHVEALRHCVKYMKKYGLEPSPYITNYMKEHLLIR